MALTYKFFLLGSEMMLPASKWHLSRRAPACCLRCLPVRHHVEFPGVEEKHRGPFFHEQRCHWTCQRLGRAAARCAVNNGSGSHTHPPELPRGSDTLSLSKSTSDTATGAGQCLRSTHFLSSSQQWSFQQRGIINHIWDQRNPRGGEGNLPRVVPANDVVLPAVPLPFPGKGTARLSLSHAAKPPSGKTALISAAQQITAVAYVNFMSYTTDTLMQMLFAEYWRRCQPDTWHQDPIWEMRSFLGSFLTIIIFIFNKQIDATHQGDWSVS